MPKLPNAARHRSTAKGITWRYYAPEIGHAVSGGDLWNAFGAIDAVRHGPEWSSNVTWPETNVFKDVSNDTLPSVTWVIPDWQNSDHPAANSDTGPSWVAQVVNAIGQSPAWDTTAIVIVWDDWGGWYDHVKPPGTYADSAGSGFRVPMIVVSPYARRGYVAHASYEFGSIGTAWSKTTGVFRRSAPPTYDQAASFIDDAFNFNQQPRAFAPIAAPYSRTFFERISDLRISRWIPNRLRGPSRGRRPYDPDGGAISQWNLTTSVPRSPKDKLLGLVSLKRTIDKAKAHNEGTLGEYDYDCPHDKPLFEISRDGADRLLPPKFKELGTDDAIADWLRSSSLDEQVASPNRCI